MQVPLEVSFQGVDRSEPLDGIIAERVAKLDQICDNLISCHLAVEVDQHDQSGDTYRIRIDMRMPPGHEIVVRHQPGGKDSNISLATRLISTFDRAERALRKQVEKQHGKVKRHPAQEVVAIIDRLFPDDGYGFLKGVDGRQYYFHRNSVLNGDFDRLKQGTGVHFTPEVGEDGMQASSVRIVDKPGGHGAPEQPES
mgnify:CR=1 FL=1